MGVHYIDHFKLWTHGQKNCFLRFLFKNRRIDFDTLLQNTVDLNALFLSLCISVYTKLSIVITVKFTTQFPEKLRQLCVSHGSKASLTPHTLLTSDILMQLFFSYKQTNCPLEIAAYNHDWAPDTIKFKHAKVLMVWTWQFIDKRHCSCISITKNKLRFHFLYWTFD